MTLQCCSTRHSDISRALLFNAFINRLLPSAEGCPGIRTPWGNEFRPMIRDGVRWAETWLDGSPLQRWWALEQSRKHHRPVDPQEAFEAGFLLRLQQTLIMRREAVTSQSSSFDA
jgi:hypothetical protein